MKKYFVLIVLVILFGCKKNEPKPTACFTLSKTSADINETIAATNCSTNASSYLWSDTNGGAATTKDANFIYAAPGTYIITLKAYLGSNSDEMQNVVTIVHKTGTVSFWQSGTPAYGNTSVLINGSSAVITTDYPSGITNCSSNGCANFTLPTGTYSFTATDNSFNWSGNVTVLADQCVRFNLQ
jgi:PKD repeat protein